MQKTIVWIGGVALLAGAALVALTARSAVGDIVFVRMSDTYEIDDVRQAQIMNCLTGPHSRVDLSEIDYASCGRTHMDPSSPNELYCDVVYNDIMTEAEYSSAVSSGDLNGSEPVSSSGSNLDVRRVGERTSVQGGAYNSCTGFAASFPEISVVGDVEEIQCHRSDTGLACRVFYFDTLPPLEFADLPDRTIRRVVGTVE